MTAATAYGMAALTGEAERVRLAKRGTRNDTLFKAAFAVGTLVPAQVPEQLAIAMLTDAALICTGDAQCDDPRLDAEISATIRSGLEAGKEKPRQIDDGYGDRGAALAHLDGIAEAFDKTPMGGWPGRRMKQFMAGALAIARQVGGPRNVPLAIRRLCIEAGVSNGDGARKALADLCETGWLTMASPGGPGHSTRYNIHVPANHPSRSPHDPTLSTPGQWERPDLATTGHDAGRKNSIGATGLRVLHHLAEHPGLWWRQAEVARALGVHAGTVGRQVKDHRPLVRLGLVERDAKGRIRAPRPIGLHDLDLAAHHTGTLGQRDQDRERTSRYLQGEGVLDESLHWIDPRDGTRSHLATWLLPELPQLRLQPSRRAHEPAHDRHVDTAPVVTNPADAPLWTLFFSPARPTTGLAPMHPPQPLPTEDDHLIDFDAPEHHRWANALSSEPGREVPA